MGAPGTALSVWVVQQEVTEDRLGNQSLLCLSHTEGLIPMHGVTGWPRSGRFGTYRGGVAGRCCATHLRYAASLLVGDLACDSGLLR